jgi:(R)-2-hydroxyglutarate dehydrogenase
LADGYSCRSQAKIIDGVRLPHPVQALLKVLQGKVLPGDRTAARAL